MGSPGKVLVCVSHVVVTIVAPFSPVNVAWAGKLFGHPHRENAWAGVWGGGYYFIQWLVREGLTIKTSSERGERK